MKLIYNKSTSKKDWINKHCQVLEGKNDFMPESPWIVIIMDGCYITSGVSIDEVTKERSTIDFLKDNGIDKVESTFQKDEYHKYPVANIGYNSKENKWYGWSHRAYHSFGIGDIPKQFYPDKTIEGNPITNIDEAKEAAKKFAESVS